MENQDIAIVNGKNLPISTKKSVELIREAKKNGVPVTCDTCPHYFSLTEEAVEEFNTLAKVNPPLRTKEDVVAVIAGSFLLAVWLTRTAAPATVAAGDP